MSVVAKAMRIGGGGVEEGEEEIKDGGERGEEGVG